MDSIQKLKEAKKWFEEHENYEDIIEELPEILDDIYIHANMCLDLLPVANQRVQSVINAVEQDRKWANKRNLEKYFLSPAHGMVDIVPLYSIARNRMVGLIHSALSYLKAAENNTVLEPRKASPFLLRTKKKAELIINWEYNDGLDSSAFATLVNEFKTDVYRVIPNESDIKQSSLILFSILPLLTKHHILKLVKQPNEHKEIFEAIKKEVKTIQAFLPNR